MSQRRSRTKQRRDEREKQRQRNRILTLVGGLVAVAVIVLLLVITTNQPSDAPIPDGIETAYEGIERGFTEEGYPFLGDIDAPVVVEEISNFACPACRQFHEDVAPALKERARQGQIRFVYVPLAVGGAFPNAEGAAKAALCAGEQDSFWEYHDLLFHWQGLFGSPFTQGRLLAGVDALGLNGGSFNSCFGGSDVQTVIDTGLVDGAGLGTPTIRVNGTTVEGITLEPIEQAIVTALADVNFTPDDTPDVEVTDEPDMETTDEPMDDMESTEEPMDDSDADMEATDEPEATEEADS